MSKESADPTLARIHFTPNERSNEVTGNIPDGKGKGSGSHSSYWSESETDVGDPKGPRESRIAQAGQIQGSSQSPERPP